MSILAQRPAFDVARRAPTVLQPLARMLPELSAYTIVSAVALAVDLVVFNALQLSGLRASVAGIAGYGVGLLLHYILSKRYVFAPRANEKTEAQRFGEFCLSGAIGALLTWFIIAVATDWLHTPAMVGKIVAVGISFIVVFLLRKSIVFAAARG
jgi:putative flippase GtrA